MGILQKLKSALGMDSSGRARRRTEPDVTVEREPSAEGERAVKTDDAEESGAPTGAEDDPADDEDDSATEEPADSAPADDGSATEESADPDADADESAEPSPSVEEITGIGATYAERLEAAGIETIADLADSDLPTVVEAAQTNESRAQDWLEQARDR
jgi:predicted flap endonuclease-1-like 5' DNA nuclease